LTPPISVIEALERITEAQDHLREVVVPFTVMHSPDERKQALIERVRNDAVDALEALKELEDLVRER